MNVNQQSSALTTATGGGLTGYVPSSGAMTGRLVSVQYVPDGSNAYASTADFTITLERTGENVWTETNVTAAKTVRPMRQAANAAGVTATNAELTEGVYMYNDRVKVVIAQGGNTKVGTFRVTTI